MLIPSATPRDCPAERRVIAETYNPAVLFETSLPPCYYIAPDAIRPNRLTESFTVTDCPYNGPGQHWHVLACGERLEDAAWSLRDPTGDATEIRDWICFYPDKIETEVDGETLAD